LKKLFLLFLILILISCAESYTPDEEKYIKGINQFRIQKDEFMKSNPGSPFVQDDKLTFEPLKYYEPDPSFVFKSTLFLYDKKDTLEIFGTKGEKRKSVRYGFFKLNFENKNHFLNVYESISRRGEKYYGIWFTDKTTNDETYGVGRYLDFTFNEDSSFVYTIDFNLAYNPYCAYSSKFSCAIPTKEDYLDIFIKAGEKKFNH